MSLPRCGGRSARRADHVWRREPRARRHKNHALRREIRRCSQQCAGQEDYNGQLQPAGATLARAINHRRPLCHSRDGREVSTPYRSRLAPRTPRASPQNHALRREIGRRSPLCARQEDFNGQLQPAGATLAHAIDHRRHQCRSHDAEGAAVRGRSRDCEGAPTMGRALIPRLRGRCREGEGAPWPQLPLARARGWRDTPARPRARRRARRRLRWNRS